MTSASRHNLLPSPWREWKSTRAGRPMRLKVWKLNVDSDPICRNAESVLSGEESARAARFSTRLLARRYVAAHAALRRLVAAEIGWAPREIRFGRAAGGKPVLQSLHAGDWDFNISHSGSWALVGMGRGVHLGVDIEELSVDQDWRLIAPEILAPSESSLSGEYACQPEYLLRLWTAKEACLKALGTGLAVSPKRLVCRTAEDSGPVFELDERLLETAFTWSIATPAWAVAVVAIDPASRLAQKEMGIEEPLVSR